MYNEIQSQHVLDDAASGFSREPWDRQAGQAPVNQAPFQ